MSRSQLNTKGPGYDYWTPRLGNNGMQGYGPEIKRRSNRLSRRISKQNLHREDLVAVLNRRSRHM